MNKDAPSLAQRLTRRLTMIAAAVVVLNIAIVGIYYGSDQRELENEALIHEIERLQVSIDGTSVPPDADLRSLYADHPAAYAFAVVDRGGAVLETTNADLIPPFARDVYADDWVIRLGTAANSLRIAGRELPDRTDGVRVVFVMASDPADLMRAAFLREFYRHVALPVLPMALVLIIASAVFLRRGLVPVAVAARWARSIKPGTDVPPPTIENAPAEVAHLVDATQRALNRLDQALASEKRNAAEAAHALRTPVAVLMARLDALPPGETTDRLRSDLLTLSRTVQQVLAASRTEAVDVPQDAAIDLSEVAETVVAGLAPFAHAKGVDLALSLPESRALANADAESVEVALSNLVENAILHGGPGPVEITVGPAPVIVVRDHGPGVSRASTTELFKPFWRGPDAAPGGAGLGLAIVDRLQRAQGGKIEVQTLVDGGCAFLLTFQNPKI
ncbi:HAMP domain-containing sensor histidine kinase [Boseongicola sp. H5]|uniref:sensor histidine kinase n=1 Tax=Boseongicola sp. H5 TaxID=2763261 RepID=UPI001D0AEBDD|nr:HAMP domain-containing sensor histidine kinase [Boseongicola sp. H5]